jgi:hypothetical protein
MPGRPPHENAPRHRIEVCLSCVTPFAELEDPSKPKSLWRFFEFATSASHNNSYVVVTLPSRDLSHRADLPNTGGEGGSNANRMRGALQPGCGKSENWNIQNALAKCAIFSRNCELLRKRYTSKPSPNASRPLLLLTNAKYAPGRTPDGEWGST